MSSFDEKCQLSGAIAIVLRKQRILEQPDVDLRPPTIWPPSWKRKKWTPRKQRPRGKGNVRLMKSTSTSTVQPSMGLWRRKRRTSRGCFCFPPEELHTGWDILWMIWNLCCLMSRKVCRLNFAENPTYLWLQTRNLIQNHNSTSSPNLRIWIIATIPYILKHGDMKTCTFGQPRRRMDRASRCMYRMCIRWMNWRWQEIAWGGVEGCWVSMEHLRRRNGEDWSKNCSLKWVISLLMLSYVYRPLVCTLTNLDSFRQIFGVPSTARRAKPFIDHILTFSIVDSRIWFRNFQVRLIY